VVGAVIVPGVPGGPVGHQPQPAEDQLDHVPGWAAQYTFAGRFPTAFIPNAVGTRLEL
jgi:hypothetical protein